MIAIIKLALVSALLSAALVIAMESKRPPQSGGALLIERIEQQVPQPSIQQSHVCADRVWPYRDDCEGAARRMVRIIGIDRLDSLGASTLRARIAER